MPKSVDFIIANRYLIASNLDSSLTLLLQLIGGSWYLKVTGWPICGNTSPCQTVRRKIAPLYYWWLRMPMPVAQTQWTATPHKLPWKWCRQIWCQPRRARSLVKIFSWAASWTERDNQPPISRHRWFGKWRREIMLSTLISQFYLPMLNWGISFIRILLLKADWITTTQSKASWTCFSRQGLLGGEKSQKAEGTSTSKRFNYPGSSSLFNELYACFVT